MISKQSEEPLLLYEFTKKVKGVLADEFALGNEWWSKGDRKYCYRPWKINGSKKCWYINCSKNEVIKKLKGRLVENFLDLAGTHTG
jgi:hypothetical protein